MGLTRRSRRKRAVDRHWVRDCMSMPVTVTDACMAAFSTADCKGQHLIILMFGALLMYPKPDGEMGIGPVRVCRTLQYITRLFVLGMLHKLSIPCRAVTPCTACAACDGCRPAPQRRPTAAP